MYKEKQEKLLNEYRSKMSKDKRIKVFKVFTSENIKDIIQAQPHSLEELSRVKGFPKDGKRIEQYGESIIEIMTRCEEIDTVEVSPGKDGAPKMKVKLLKLDLF